jgi:3-hydroxybutyryl-CoA dehydrogenase
MNASGINTFGVIGAGQMGSGIAQVAAATGLTVLLQDVSKEVAQKAKDKIGAVLTRQVEKGKLTAEDRDALLGRIQPVDGPADLANCDIVVEAATENFDLKIKLLKAVDASLKAGAILASNTSSISITKLAAATSRPSSFIGMHFMNPVPLMKLVEVVKGVQTSKETYEATRELAVRLGKTVTTSNDAPGFLVNRILIPLLNEAAFAFQEGVGSLEDIDTGAKLGLNHPMGPFELADLIGLDTVLAIAEVLYREIGDDKYRAPTVLRNLVAAGWYGRKTGKGFYVYDEKGQRTGASI